VRATRSVSSISLPLLLPDEDFSSLSSFFLVTFLGAVFLVHALTQIDDPRKRSGGIKALAHFHARDAELPQGEPAFCLTFSAGSIPEERSMAGANLIKSRMQHGAQS